MVEEPEAFEQWLAGYPTYAQTRDQSPGDPAAGAPLYAVCSSCHGQAAEGNPVLNAPKLSGQSGWYLARQLRYFKDGVRGAVEADQFGKLMTPMAATLVDDTAIANVVAYIGTLPDRPSAPTTTANLANGHKLYQTCSVCHGSDGTGIRAMNAPRISGLDDWYLSTQLKNFKQGIRGAHSLDAYGQQMISMAKIIPDDRAINDLVFYINTLR